MVMLGVKSPPLAPARRQGAVATPEPRRAGTARRRMSAPPVRPAPTPTMAVMSRKLADQGC